MANDDDIMPLECDGNNCYPKFFWKYYLLLVNFNGSTMSFLIWLFFKQIVKYKILF